MQHEVLHGPSHSMLKVKLEPGEKFIAEAGTMVTHTDGVKMEAKLNAGSKAGCLGMIFAIFMSGLASFGVPLVFERNYFEYRDNSKKLAQLLYSSLCFILTNFVVLAGITYLYKENISNLLIRSAISSILSLLQPSIELCFNDLYNIISFLLF